MKFTGPNTRWTIALTRAQKRGEKYVYKSRVEMMQLNYADGMSYLRNYARPITGLLAMLLDVTNWPAG